MGINKGVYKRKNQTAADLLFLTKLFARATETRLINLGVKKQDRKDEWVDLKMLLRI